MYVGFDLISEAKLRAGTLTGLLASTHYLFDHLIPILAGGLTGQAIYQLRLRVRLAAAEEAAENQYREEPAHVHVGPVSLAIRGPCDQG